MGVVRSFLTAAFGLLLSFQAFGLSYSNSYRSPRNPERHLRKATRLIILHTTEAHERSSLNKLSERGECHFCLTADGTAYRIIDLDREAFHAGRSMWNGHENCDSFSVGIEVVGYHDKPMPLVQIQALKELVAKLKSMYNIPDVAVVCHSHVAYGAPNKWFKRNNRGRKRCGMLFAMPSVRAKLGLRAKPAVDPDIKAGRLIQGDQYLATVLYGNVDTMSAFYRGGTPAAVSAKVAGGTGKGGRPAPKRVEEKKEDGGIFAGISGFFKRKAKLVMPETGGNADGDDALPDDGITVVMKPEPAKAKSSQPAPQKKTVAKVSSQPAKPLPAKKIPVPPASSPRDLETLKTLPGYTQLGPVTPTMSPYRLAGKAWDAPSTYYWTRNSIVPGNKVNPSQVERGALIFVKK